MLQYRSIMKNPKGITKPREIVKSKQLAQVHFSSDPHQFKVAYILGGDDEDIVLAEINDTGTSDGVSVSHMDDVLIIKVETNYLAKLETKIDRELIYKQAMNHLEGIKELTFDGFISRFENADTIVEISGEEGFSIAGRIVGHTTKMLVLDEYSINGPDLAGRAYINRAAISRIAIDIPYLRSMV